MQRLWKIFGPSVAFMGWGELAQAVTGLCFGLGVMCLLLIWGAGAAALPLWFIPTFAATAALIFVVPNNPLAQPWPIFIGYSCALTAGLSLRQLVGTAEATTGVTLFAAPIVTLALMALLRALHPPAIAFAAMLVAAPETFAGRGFELVFFPVGPALLALTVSGAVYAQATGRRYPAQRGRPPPRYAPSAGRTRSSRLSNAQLTQLLRDYRQSANISAEDLAQVMAAAGLLATTSAQPNARRCSEIMSRDLITLAPNAPLETIDALFRRHGFISLPVTETDSRYLGMIFQIQLINGLANAPAQPRRGVWQNLRAAAQGPKHYRARDLMVDDVPSLAPDSPIEAALPLLAERQHYAIPILQDMKIVGVVTRSDLVSALALQNSNRTDHDL